MLKKALLVAVPAAIASMLFSGCFLMRTLTYTDDKVEPGDKTTAKVSVNGDTGAMKNVFKFGDAVQAKGGSDGEIPFFLMEAEDDATKLTNGGKFDTGGKFAGPKDLKTNPALAALAADDCSFALAAGKQGPPPPSTTAVATEQPFDANNAQKIIEAKIPIKPNPNVLGGVAFGLTMGTWFDDGDEVPEDPGSTDDEYECQPPYISTVVFKGPAPAP